MKAFSEKQGFVMAYLEHLMHLPELNNTRVLFERALANFSSEDAEPIWAAFLHFEALHGDLAAVCWS